MRRKGLIFAEAAMMALGPHIGKSEAHHAVKAAFDRAIQEGVHLREALLRDDRVLSHMTVEEINAVFDGPSYSGVAAQLIARAIAAAPSSASHRLVVGQESK